MITGWDETGLQLYYIDDDGSCIKGTLFACGSGSTFAYSVLDNYYCPDLIIEEAIDLGARDLS